MYIHHIAYLVDNTEQSARALTKLGARLVVDRRPVESQKAFVSFLEQGDGSPLIELVEPFPDNHTMLRKLRREHTNSVLYHVGYLVDDFNDIYQTMRKKGWLPLSLPFEGFNEGCKASHLYNPGLGIIEIMQRPA